LSGPRVFAFGFGPDDDYRFILLTPPRRLQGTENRAVPTRGELEPLSRQSEEPPAQTGRTRPASLSLVWREQWIANWR
jgi:hypothetical protein